MKTALMIFPMELKRFGFCMVSFLKIALLFASNYIKNNEITSRIMKLLWLEVLSISLSLCLTSVDQFSSMRLRILLKFSCALEILRSSSRASSEKMPFDFTERSFNLRLKNDSNIAPEKVWRIRKAGVCFIDEIGRGSRELFSKLTAFLKLKTQPYNINILILYYININDNIFLKKHLKNLNESQLDGGISFDEFVQLSRIRKSSVRDWCVSYCEAIVPHRSDLDTEGFNRRYSLETNYSKKCEILNDCSWY